MEQYIGVKIVDAEPGIGQVEDGPGMFKESDGYKVRYEDGYESWSPKEVFEKAYRVTNELLPFGYAIEALKLGLKVARKGWNGKDMFVKYVDQVSYIDEGGTVNYILPCLVMNTVDGDLIPWLASQSDILANDWFVVEQ